MALTEPPHLPLSTINASLSLSSFPSNNARRGHFVPSTRSQIKLTSPVIFIRTDFQV